MRFDLIPRALLALVAASLIASCDAPAPDVHLTGTATYLDRALLPPDAVLEVILSDMSTPGSSAPVLATQRLEGLGAPPYAFDLTLDAQRIADDSTYGLSARVQVGDRLLMVTDTFVPVLARGFPDRGIELTLRRVSASTSASPEPAAARTVPNLRLPATFRGTLPMASGPGAEWHLDLWPDQVFHLSQRFGGEADPQADIGRWSAASTPGVIVLRGGREAPVFLAVQDDGDLRLMDRSGAPIESDLNYTLSAEPLEAAEVALPMGGMFRYQADAAVFEECLTGRSYPVAMEGAYIDAERAYTQRPAAAEAPGAPVYALLEGQLAPRPAMEGPDRVHLIIDRFSRLAPDMKCPA